MSARDGSPCWEISDLNGMIFSVTPLGPGILGIKTWKVYEVYKINNFLNSSSAYMMSSPNFTLHINFFLIIMCFLPPLPCNNVLLCLYTIKLCYSLLHSHPWLLLWQFWVQSQGNQYHLVNTGEYKSHNCLTKRFPIITSWWFSWHWQYGHQHQFDSRGCRKWPFFGSGGSVPLQIWYSYS